MTVAVAVPADPTTTLDEPTVDLFAKYPELDAVRREINRIRVERGGDPIYDLPKGTRLATNACVLARCLADVGITKVDRSTSLPHSEVGRTTAFFGGDSVLAQFAQDFDFARYPELVQP